MADQGRWFKLWYECLSDPDLGNFSIADFGRWAKFGVYLKTHGTDGSIVLRSPCTALQNHLQLVSFEDVIMCISRFPNCQISRDDSTVTSSDDQVTVKWLNWRKYQVDSSAERQRRYRHRVHYGVTTKKRREERRGEVEEKNTPPTSPDLFSKPSLNGWGNPESLVDLYNELTPDECPSVEKLTPARRKKCFEYLKTFPDREFWVTVFTASKASRFLRGLKNQAGHEHFVMNLDWLLSKGKSDQVENCVKVFEGRYADG